MERDKLLIIAMIALCLVMIIVPVFMYFKGRKAKDVAVPFNNTLIGTIFFVFKHEGNIAEMSPIEWMSPHKENKGNKFIIPELFGKLEVGKTYELIKGKIGESFEFKQVAVMLD